MAKLKERRVQSNSQTAINSIKDATESDQAPEISKASRIYQDWDAALSHTDRSAGTTRPFLPQGIVDAVQTIIRSPRYRDTRLSRN